MYQRATSYNLAALEAADTASRPSVLTFPAPLPAAPDFPLTSLPPALRDMVENAARQTGAPVSLCAAAGLGAASAAIGGGLLVQSAPACLTPANLFILAIAESGSGKGRAFSAMLAPWQAEAARRAEEWRTETQPDLQADLETARADLERGKKERRTSTDPVLQASAVETIRAATRAVQEAEHALLREPILNIGNATAEAIAETLAHAPGESAAILSSEARDTVDNLLGRYSRDGRGSDEPIFLQAYSGDPVNVKRKGRPILSLTAPRLTLCLAAQPDTWQRLTRDGRMMESGFLARTLAFDAKARPARPSAHSIPPETVHAWERTLLALLTFRDEPGPPRIVEPQPDARTLLENLAGEAASSREPGGPWHEVASFAARVAENAWRLALVLHAIRHGAESPDNLLSPDTARAADALTRWFFQETLALLAPVRSDRRVTRMEKLHVIFARKNTTTLPLYRLRENHGYTREELLTLAEEFPKLLRITTFSPGEDGGRSSECACIAPFAA
jgi:hypothetical protein